MAKRKREEQVPTAGVKASKTTNLTSSTRAAGYQNGDQGDVRDAVATKDVDNQHHGRSARQAPAELAS